MQFSHSFPKMTLELVDCRGAQRPDALSHWELACPPDHIELRTGTPWPRFAPALHGNATGAWRRCDCGQDATAHISCAEAQSSSSPPPAQPMARLSPRCRINPDGCVESPPQQPPAKPKPSLLSPASPPPSYTLTSIGPPSMRPPSPMPWAPPLPPSWPPPESPPLPNLLTIEVGNVVLLGVAYSGILLLVSLALVTLCGVLICFGPNLGSRLSHTSSSSAENRNHDRNQKSDAGTKGCKRSAAKKKQKKLKIAQPTWAARKANGFCQLAKQEAQDDTDDVFAL